MQRPQIYYGELTREPVVVNTSEAEFDHPSGVRNVDIHYPGDGGVQLSNTWRRGSNVIRGNVLAMPLDDTLYVEPIYLEAETAAYPELRLVVAMHGDRMSYGETFDAALGGLFGAPVAAPATGAAGAQLPGTPLSLAQQANQAFEAYLRLQAQQRFDAAAEQLQKLRDALHELAQRPSGP